MRRRDLITVLGAAGVAPLLAPLAAYPQSNRKIPVVGYLWHAGSAEEEQPYYGAVVDGFTQLGYVDGRNIKLEHRFPDEKPDLFKSMAAELVALNPDVLMGGAVATSYLRDATPNIPIVFMFVPDPIGLRLVKSFAQPGGNVTGFVNFGRDLVGKRLQSLKDIVPNLSRVALLVNSQQPAARIYSEESRTVAGGAWIVCAGFRCSRERSLGVGLRRNAESRYASFDYRVWRKPIRVEGPNSQKNGA